MFKLFSKNQWFEILFRCQTMNLIMRSTIISLAFLSVALLMSCSDSLEDQTVEELVPEETDCQATNSLVGRTMPLRRSELYGISGDVTIISDCEIQLSNFFYNGLGPAVSFYGAVNGNFRAGFNMSQILNGRRWEGETLNLFVPEGFTIGDVNSFSVWCFQFDIDFSSVFFR